MGHIFCMILYSATAHLLNWKQVVSETNTMRTNNMILHDEWIKTGDDKKFDTILTALDLSGNEMGKKTINNENVKDKMKHEQGTILEQKEQEC